MYRRPVSWIIGGVAFEPLRGERGTFYALAFVQPLYVPLTHWTFVVSHEVDRGRLWKSATFVEQDWQKLVVSIRREAIPFLDLEATPESVSKRLLEDRKLTRQIEYVEFAAYSLLVANRETEARQVLAMADSLFQGLSTPRPSERECHQRCARIGEELARNVSTAVTTLSSWRTFTLSSLGILPDEYDPPT